MGLVNKSIQNVINGVSQQPPSIRLDNQVEAQVNMMPDVTNGLIRRNPAKLESVLNASTSQPWTSNDEEFQLSYKQYISGTFKDITLGIGKAGNAYYYDDTQMVDLSSYVSSSAKAYLTHTDPKNIKAVETADKIYILNKENTVTSNKLTSLTGSGQRAMMWIMKFSAGQTYTVHLKNAYNTTLVSVSSTTASTTLEAALEELRTGLDSLSSTDYVLNAESNNNVIVINASRSTVLWNHVTIESNYGSDSAYAIVEHNPLSSNKYSVSSTIPLPVLSSVQNSLSGVMYLSSFKIMISDSAGQDVNDVYYLSFSPSSNTWYESKDSFTPYLDTSTMPVVIDKTSTFSIGLGYWDTPQVGDINTNKLPSFVDSTISDIITFNSRLVFASGNTLVFSSLESMTNLFRTTATEVLTSDVIDIELDSSRIGYSDIDNVFVLDGKLIINTARTQSALNIPVDGNILKAYLAKVSAYNFENSYVAEVGSMIYISKYSNGYSTIHRYYSLSSTTNSAIDMTKHAQLYIKGNVNQILSIGNNVFIRTDDDRKVLYIQSYLINDNSMVQNAWHKWEFDYPIKHLINYSNKLYIIFDSPTNEKPLRCYIDLEPQDIVEDTSSQIGYNPYLDFQTTSNTNRDLLVDVSTITVSTTTGKLVGDTDSNRLHGVPYSSYVTLSEIVPRRSDSSGNQSVIAYSSLMLRRMKLMALLSGRIYIDVTRSKRGTLEYNHSPVKSGELIIGRPIVGDNEVRFSINGRSKDVTITIKTKDTYTPMRFYSIEWQGSLIIKGQGR